MIEKIFEEVDFFELFEGISANNLILAEQLEKIKRENQELKEDIKNIIKILDKNTDDLEATEEEFESLYRWENER